MHSSEMCIGDDWMVHYRGALMRLLHLLGQQGVPLDMYMQQIEAVSRGRGGGAHHMKQ